MLSLLALFRTISLPYVRKRWDRATLITASIALGVAMLVSTQLLNACLDAAVDESTLPGAEDADLVVTNNRRVRMDLLPRLQAIAGIRSAQPLIIERVLLPDKDNRSAVLIGIDTQHGQEVAKDNPVQAEMHVFNPVALLSGRGVAIGKDLQSALASKGGHVDGLKLRCGGVEHEVIPGATIEAERQSRQIGRLSHWHGYSPGRETLEPGRHLRANRFESHSRRRSRQGDARKPSSHRRSGPGSHAGIGA